MRVKFLYLSKIASVWKGKWNRVIFISVNLLLCFLFWSDLSYSGSTNLTHSSWVKSNWSDLTCSTWVKQPDPFNSDKVNSTLPKQVQWVNLTHGLIGWKLTRSSSTQCGSRPRALILAQYSLAQVQFKSVQSDFSQSSPVQSDSSGSSPVQSNSGRYNLIQANSSLVQPGLGYYSPVQFWYTLV